MNFEEEPDKDESFRDEAERFRRMRGDEGLVHTRCFMPKASPGWSACRTRPVKIHPMAIEVTIQYSSIYFRKPPSCLDYVIYYIFFHSPQSELCDKAGAELLEIFLTKVKKKKKKNCIKYF